MSLSSSEAACPETWTAAVPLCTTVAPAFESRLMTRLTAFSLPGIGRSRDDDGVALLDGDRPVIVFAIRARADRGSPWLPGGEDDDPFRRQISHLVRIDEVVIGDREDSRACVRSWCC
jgi:hypothetical protein